MGLQIYIWLIFVALVNGQSLPVVRQGFPEVWNGDRYFRSQCENVQKLPAWLNGYLFCQLSASYGDQSAPEGQKVTHMFDAMGAVGVFEIGAESGLYTGAYYPTFPYKVWNFYNRDMRRSKIAWRTFHTKINVSAAEQWTPFAEGKKRYPSPNVDFWLVNGSILAGSETVESLVTFEPTTVDGFRPFPFQDDPSSQLGRVLTPIQMPIHERMDPDSGRLWATLIALNLGKTPPSVHQVIFSVDTEGKRTIEGVYDYPEMNFAACNPNGEYTGNRLPLPRYMHSITSTDRYIVLPMTSAYMSPCRMMNFGRSLPKMPVYDPSKDWPFVFDNSVPLTFMLFDKVRKVFLPPIHSSSEMFVSHQLNAYQTSDKTMVVDLIGYSADAYDSLTVTNAVDDSHKMLINSDLRRFTIDTEQLTVSNNSILPSGERLPLEFPQFNHRLEGKRYKYAYAVINSYSLNTKLIKFNVDDVTGSDKKFFVAPPEVSLSEPYFVQRPNTSSEDDGVLVLRGLDTSINKTRVYVIDAKDMNKIGEIIAPTILPFGFHERFYLKSALKSSH